MLLSGCSGTTTLKDLSEMTPLERQQLTEIKLDLNLPEGAEFNFWKTFEGCTNLTKVEISENFKGEITGYENMHNGPKHLKTIIAKGASKIGYSCFYAGAEGGYNCDLETVIIPNAQTLDLHAFGSSNRREVNLIRELDLPSLTEIGSQLAGCKNLTTLKLGYDGPMFIYATFGKSINAANIDLYIGQYEYEHHVKGNTLYPYVYGKYVNLPYGQYLEKGTPGVDEEHLSGNPITFKSIRPYK